MRATLRFCLTIALASLLGACALLPQRDPVNISVVGIEALPSQDLELRLAVKLRLQNPNDSVIDYDGVALDLDINGRGLASGVSDQQGTIGRFSETVLTVPVSISAFSVLRQTLGLSQGQGLQGLPYVVRGKLAGGCSAPCASRKAGYWTSAPRYSPEARLRDPGLSRYLLAAAISLLTSLLTMLAYSGGDIWSSSLRTHSDHLPLRRGFLGDQPGGLALGTADVGLPQFIETRLFVFDHRPLGEGLVGQVETHRSCSLLRWKVGRILHTDQAFPTKPLQLSRPAGLHCL